MKAAPPDILSLLSRLAEDAPERIALEQTGRASLSRRDLLRDTVSVARRLSGAAPGRRPRIGIVLPNGMGMAVALLGSALAGAALPFNPAYTRSEFEAYFRETRIDVLLLADGESGPAAVAAATVGVPVVRVRADGTLADAMPEAALPAPSPDDVALVLLTSGSTGRAKSVPLTHRNVCASAVDVSASMGLGPEDRCLAMWEQYHVGGLVDLLLAPLASGGTVICTEGFRTAEALRLLVDARPTWFQVVPTTLGDLVAQARREGLDPARCKLRLLRSVAAALPPRLMAEAESLLGVPVLQTFGMTEAGPLITSTPLPPAVRKPGSVGRSCGCEIRVVDGAWVELPVGQTGQVAIRGPNVFRGYEDDAGANAAQFRDGWFLTGDLGRLDPEGDLFLVGRVKQLINRGGEKVNPQEVDDALLTHPDVAEAACFPVPHPTLGEDVAAAVVPRGSLDLDALRAHLASRLAPFKVPGRIDIRDALPRNAVGKIDRLELARLPAPRAATPSASAATPLEERLAGLWARELGRDNVGLDDDFSALGGDSLAAVRLLVAVERELGIGVPRERVASLRTVRQMARCLSEPGATRVRARLPSVLDADSLLALEAVNALSSLPVLAGTSTLLVLRSEGSRPALVWCCNKPATMRRLSPALGFDQPLYAFYSGGRALPNDPSFLDRLAEHHADDILRAFPEGTLFLGGNCKGGWVVARVARILAARGRTIAGLCLLEHAEPFLAEADFPQVLVFGRQSRMRAYEKVGLGPDGPASRHRIPPQVAWIGGEHGHFFEPGNVEELAGVVRAFMDGRPVPARSDNRQTSRLLFIHRTRGLAYMQRKLYRAHRWLRMRVARLTGRGAAWKGRK